MQAEIENMHTQHLYGQRATVPNSGLLVTDLVSFQVFVRLMTGVKKLLGCFIVLLHRFIALHMFEDVCIKDLSTQ